MLINEDITVVVQGPVQARTDREQDEGITHRCLCSVREFLPGATIVLSTWAGQDLEGLDFDDLVINEDPGPNIREYKPSGEPLYMNNNRQIASSLGGLKAVTTPYAMKLRSDNYLTSNSFQHIQQSYKKRSKEYCFFDERVLVCDLFTRQYNKGKKVAFHVSDFFYFGRTKDVLSIWDIPYIEDLQYREDQKGLVQYEGVPFYRKDCTQLLWLKAMHKYDTSLSILHQHDSRVEVVQASNKIYANNLVVASCEEIGLGLCNKFKGKARAARKSGKASFMSYLEWQRLYKQHVDPKHEINNTRGLLVLQLWRLLLVYPRRLEMEVKLLLRRFQYR